MDRSHDTPERWQIEALVETLGDLRSRLAHQTAHHERERADVEQKLEAAKDALGKLELNEGVYGQQLAKSYEQIDALKAEVARTKRERDDARALLETTWRPGNKDSAEGKESA